MILVEFCLWIPKVFFFLVYDAQKRQKYAMTIYDVMTLHSIEPSSGRKWKECLQIWHVDLSHEGR